MTDPTRLAEIKAHLARVVQQGALSKDQLRSDEYLGELIGEVEWLQGEVERLRELLEPTVIVSPPPKPDPGNEEDAPPKEGVP